MRLRIRDLREDLDLKQFEAAKGLYMDPATYCRYEAGKIDIPLSALIRMAIYYDTSIDYLVGLTDKSGRKIVESRDNH